jgi:hypothetical protein
MENNLIFANQGVLSLVDLLTIGHSHKKDDSSTIGQFNTGLITALAIAVRNNITVNIYSGGYKYFASKSETTDSVSGKVKEILAITQIDINSGEETIHETGFGIYLGLNWSVQMIIREVYSNCLDEKGLRVSEIDFDAYDTHIEVINNHLEIQDVIENWGEYFLDNPEILTTYCGVAVIPNHLPNSPYVIYKNGIQVYRDETRKSWFLYNCKDVEIDEMRILLNKTSAEVENSYAVRTIKDKDVIHNFLNNLTEDYQEWDNANYGTFSNEWVEVVNNLFIEDELRAYPFSKSFKEDSRFKVGSVRVEYGSYSSPIKVEVTPVIQPEEVALSFEEKIIKMASELNFTFEYPIKQSTLSSNFKVLADRKEHCLYVDSSFVEDDMWQLVREVFKLLSTDPYKEYVNLLKSQLCLV